jgi:UDP-N-acetyl-2-amino-2-deoxyglucuronate dehydrogenase
MLIWIFGDVKQNITHQLGPSKASGYLELEQARIRWFLSIDANDLPLSAKEKRQRTFRSITMDDEEIEFSQGFTDLHTHTYREILAGNGFGLEESKKSIEVVYTIRNATPVGCKGEVHPLCK